MNGLLLLVIEHFWVMCVPHKESIRRNISGYLKIWLFSPKIHRKTTTVNQQDGGRWLVYKLLCNWWSTSHYKITQVILAFWLVPPYGLLEGRRMIDFITTKCFHLWNNANRDKNFSSVSFRQYSPEYLIPSLKFVYDIFWCQNSLFKAKFSNTM